MDLRIAIRSGCFCPGIGLVLAKVMKSAKEIRSGDKNAGPLRLGAGRLLAFLGAGEARMEGQPPGLVVLSVAARRRGDGLPGMAAAGNVPAAIRRYLISN